ncbi:hypothetical protein GYMLUDRAFT_970431 [Collybiopsis luxurians FD-317 M1]|uniref:Transmembrane protein n=1 Tax=Collybiopsis luxurians FD-317 M1 TaxID=944289 RepID=A0A0D0C3A7_9AGAR|nr:hypothetical protein GYMLUDRAFT_970431 [Collybiopsis luxurians FD-317 M1]
MVQLKFTIASSTMHRKRRVRETIPRTNKMYIIWTDVFSFRKGKISSISFVLFRLCLFLFPSSLSYLLSISILRPLTSLSSGSGLPPMYPSALSRSDFSISILYLTLLSMYVYYYPLTATATSTDEKKVQL